MEPKQAYRNQSIAILGHKGSGKSTWLLANIDSFEPFVLVDPLYDPKFDSIRGYRIKNLQDGYELFRDGQPRRVVLSPNAIVFDFFCGLTLAKGDLTLVVDEVDNYATAHNIPPYFRQVIKYGRHRNVQLVCAARRPMEMAPLIRTQASRFIVFPLGDEDGRDMEAYIGREARVTIRSLQINEERSQYLDYDFRTKKGVVKEIVYVGFEKEALDTEPTL